MLEQFRLIFISGVIFTIAEFIKTKDLSALKKPITLIEAFYLTLQVILIVPSIYYFKLLLIYISNFIGLQPFHIFDGLSLSLQILLLFFFGDLVNYWMHRLLHTKPLWSFHSIHHSLKELRWAKAQIAHPIDPIITFGVIYYFIYLFNFSLESVIFVQLISFLYGLLCHSKLDFHFGLLDYIFISPKAHHLHHRQGKQLANKNFSSFFSLWDILFGTYEKPGKDTIKHYGIKGLELETLSTQLLHPFKKSKGK